MYKCRSFDQVNRICDHISFIPIVQYASLVHCSVYDSLQRHYIYSLLCSNISIFFSLMLVSRTLTWSFWQAPQQQTSDLMENFNLESLWRPAKIIVYLCFWAFFFFVLFFFFFFLPFALTWTYLRSVPPGRYFLGNMGRTWRVRPQMSNKIFKF